MLGISDMSTTQLIVFILWVCSGIEMLLYSKKTNNWNINSKHTYLWMGITLIVIIIFDKL